MITYDRYLDNSSYTNKDFNSIYSELLDLADNISPKWKPSQSTESDPGVLLLKLDALMADKANYNIDKNILELFPSSVTQYPNAREIFEQCGYIMPYYRAAEVIVSMNIKNLDKIKEKLDSDDLKDAAKTYTYKLPRFTMVSDTDNTCVYTIIEDIDLSGSQEVCQIKALQGIIQDYKINNDNIITFEHLDSNNRLYFSETNIAENGIFITSINSENYSDWLLVDNLLVEPVGSYCYKFGISRDGSRCYVEFPSDISALIGEGILIKYLLTDGYSGNIGKSTLTNFYSESTSVNVYNRSSSIAEDIAVDIESIYITNMLASENGKDPETIAEARRNYNKVKNTFNTLVSLDDYNNFLYNSDQCSNGFMCDRTNDIQHSYKVQTSNGKEEYQVVKVAKELKELSEPILDAFDLRLYATRYINPINDEDRFDITFEPITSIYKDYIISDMEDVKSIQHNINLPTNDKLAYIILDYPIKAKIIPYNKLTLTQELEVLGNVTTALYEHLNSTQISFGEEIEYDYIYDIICDSDNRIKSLILDELIYTAKVVKYDSTAANGYTITDLSSTGNSDIVKEIKAKCILSGVTPLLTRPDSIVHTIAQTEGSYTSALDKLTTEASIEFKFDGDNTATYEIQKNESIYLTANNYITDQTYSTYVKYFYNLSSNINTNDVHELGDGEDIYFFWKTSSDDAAGYKYIKYGKGTFISPSFILSAKTNIPATDSGYASAGLSIVLSKLLESSGDVPDATTLVEGTSYTYNEIIAACRNNCILDGSKIIYTKKQNSVILTKKEFTKNSVTYPALPKAYWVLNNKIDDEYVLFDSGDDDPYILDIGEYLFYTNPEGTIFSMVGAGTKITREGSTDKLSVKAAEYSDILIGLNTYLTENDLWHTIRTNEKITLTEKQFHNLGEGITVKLQASEALTDSIILNNTLTSLDIESIKYTISYKNPDSAEYEKLPSMPNGWEIRSRLSLNCGPGKSQELNANQKIKISDDPDTDLTNVIVQSDYEINISGGENIDIRYKPLLGDPKKVKLFKYNEVDNSDNTITIGEEKISVNLIKNTDITLPTFKLPNDANNKYLLPILLKTEYESLNVITYKSTDYLWIKLTSDVIAGKKYTVKNTLISTNNITEFTTKDEWKKITTGFGNYIIESDDMNASFKYIITSSTNEPTDEGTLYTSQVNYGTLSTINEKLINNQGLYFIDLTTQNSNSDIDLCIKHTYSGNAESTSIDILPLIKFSNTTILTDPIFTKLKSLDFDGQFNYGYIVPEDILISNPVAPEAFLDKNHPFNRCTICRWDHDAETSSISVTNKIK